MHPNALFGDHAVLQRGRSIPVWGTASPGSTITVKLDAVQASAAVDPSGAWRVLLPAMSAGGPYSLEISGDGKVEFQDVMVGEVWLAGGQSNMAFELNRASDGPQAIEESENPNIRMFRVKAAKGKDPTFPQTEIAGGWESASPKTSAPFSAVAWFFAKRLQETLHVPVGIINNAVGGSPAEAWTSKETLESDPILAPVLSADMQRLEEDDKRALGPTDVDASKPLNRNQVSTLLYNQLLAPLDDYGIRGVIWYQGEQNFSDPARYRVVLPQMIADWRRQWHEDMPFYIVQLPNLGLASPGVKGHLPLIRSVQADTANSIRNSGYVVTMDVGDPKNIHPANKHPVGDRLAYLALAKTYGQNLEWSGPTPTKVMREKHDIKIEFSHADHGLVAKNGPLGGFAIAGAPSVASPEIVRYGWADNPVDANLYNQAGLPAAPFATDRLALP
jgi:sialate O-acetylesterase